MKNRLLLIVSMVVVPLLVSLRAQSPQEPDILSGLEEFRTLRNMLPEYLNRLAMTLLEERERKMAGISSAKDIAERKEYVRGRMLKALGGLPERTPLNPRVVGVLDREDYKIEKVIFESQPRFYVTANLYRPKKGQPPYPGVLFPLGHEAGAKSHSTWQQILGSLAQKGYVALTWDPVGQGERVQLYDPDFGESKVFRSTTEHSIVGIQCLLVGDNLARYTIWDGMRALDYLLSRKEVDPERIACTGNSGGGTHTAYLSALDDRIKVAAPSCYLTSFRRLLTSIGPQDAEQNLPPFLGDGLDHADFIYAFTPKPYLMLSAIKDFFSISGARETYAEAKRIYSLLGIPEKLHMVEADDYHGYTKPRRLAAYDWFARWLRGTGDQSSEPEVKLFTEEELRCTATGQVSTSLGGESVFSLNGRRADLLRAKRGSVSTQADPGKYRDRIRLRVQESARLESSRGPVTVKPYGEVKRAGYRVEKLIYESEPGIIVPSLLYVPDTGEVRKPAVLYVHRRGKGAAGPEAEEWARNGFVVLAIDVRGMGETQVAQTQQSSDTRPFFGDFDSAMTALLVGRPLVGMRALDIVRGVDLLAARAEVDPERIFAYGREAGGVPLLYAAVLDERIKRIAVEGMLISYQIVVTQRIHRQVLESVVWGVLKDYDLPDLVAALAPRAAWVVNGVDGLGHRVPVEKVKKEYERTTAAFRAAGRDTFLRIAERRDDEPLQTFYRALFNHE